MSTFTSGTRITGTAGTVYVVNGLISRGGFSCVYKAHLYSDKRRVVALKFVDKRKVHGKALENLDREITIAREVQHPNILVMYEVIPSPMHLIMVLEYVEGGELFSVLKAEGILSLQQNVRILTQVCDAVAYLHAHSISHRDIKPENILCTAPAEPFDVKIADFGLSKQYRQDFLTTCCGTLHYAAPEVIGGKKAYSEQCDMWSIGVLAFVLLTGSFPFDGPIEAVKEKICGGAADLRKLDERHVCPLAQDLIRRLLVVDPDTRLTAGECLEHPFLHIFDVEKDIEIPLDLLD